MVAHGHGQAAFRQVPVEKIMAYSVAFLVLTLRRVDGHAGLQAGSTETIRQARWNGTDEIVSMRFVSVAFLYRLVAAGG